MSEEMNRIAACISRAEARRALDQWIEMKQAEKNRRESLAPTTTSR